MHENPTGSVGIWLSRVRAYGHETKSRFFDSSRHGRVSHVLSHRDCDWRSLVLVKVSSPARRSAWMHQAR